MCVWYSHVVSSIVVSCVGPNKTIPDVILDYLTTLLPAYLATVDFAISAFRPDIITLITLAPKLPFWISPS